MNKSEFYFKIVTPALLIAGGVIFFRFCTELRQLVLIEYLVIYYLAIWLCKRLFGKQKNSEPPVLPSKIGKEKFESLQEIAKAEYEYIRETMAQAMDDRHTMINYFLLATGVALAAVGMIFSKEGMQELPFTKELTIGICLIFNGVAWIYMLKMVRLRQAWCDSSLAMNRIKNFFLVNVKMDADQSGSPFLWKSSTSPAPGRIGNLFHLEFILISFISALAISGISMLRLTGEQTFKFMWIPGIFFLFHFALQLSTFHLFLPPENAGTTSVNVVGKAARPSPN